MPPKGTGGETKYLDSRTACEEMPESLREELEKALGCKLEDVVLHNSLMHNRKLGSPEYFKNIEPLDAPVRIDQASKDKLSADPSCRDLRWPSINFLHRYVRTKK